MTKWLENSEKDFFYTNNIIIPPSPSVSSPFMAYIVCSTMLLNLPFTWKLPLPHPLTVLCLNMN